MLDSSALIALYDPADSHHLDATATRASIVAAAYPMVVTLPTLHESHRHVLYSRGSEDAERCVFETRTAVNLLDRTCGSDDDAAFGLMRQYRSLALSLTDAVNMAVMLRLGIATAFAFDSDFYKVGFLVTPPFPPWSESTAISPASPAP